MRIDTKSFPDFFACYIRLKIDLNDIFEKKLGLMGLKVLSKRGPKCYQNEFFQVLPKVNEWNRSDLLHEVRVA